MNINVLIGEALKSFEPPPIMATAEWAREHLILPPETPIPGQYRVWPMMEEPLNVMGDTITERVTLMKAARIGFTKCLVASLAKTIDTKPCPIIMLLPREQDAIRMATEEVTPVFAASPRMAKVLRDDRVSGRTTLTIKTFPGGSVKMIAARSPDNLRSHDAKYLYCDEVDAMEITEEGDPITLAEKRTQAHHDRKIIIGSTPKIEGLSIVERHYNKSDKRIYEVPCPHCGAFFEIRWRHIKWSPGKPSEAYLKCPHCKEPIEERFKREMGNKGKWRRREPHIIGHAGFRLNAFLSPLPGARWGILAQEYTDAVHAGSAEIMVFVNTVEGRPWRETQGAAVTPQGLMDRREDYETSPVHEYVLLITIGVDIQPDRWEAVVLGHGEGEETWELNYIIHRGSPGDPDYWQAMTDLIDKTYVHPLGGRLKAEGVAVDSGDDTQRVYEYVQTQRSAGKTWVWAIKGAPGEKRPIWERSTGKKSIAAARGVKLQIIGVDNAKTQIFSNAARANAGPGYMHFRSTNLEFYNQLLGETVRTRVVKGRPKREWLPLHNRRHEVLDCYVYAIAARHSLSVEWDARRIRMAISVDVKPLDPAEIARNMRF